MGAAADRGPEAWRGRARPVAEGALLAALAVVLILFRWFGFLAHYLGAAGAAWLARRHGPLAGAVQVAATGLLLAVLGRPQTAVTYTLAFGSAGVVAGWWARSPGPGRWLAGVLLYLPFPALLAAYIGLFLGEEAAGAMLGGLGLAGAAAAPRRWAVGAGAALYLLLSVAVLAGALGRLLDRVLRQLRR